MIKEDCLFCKIAKGEIHSATVYEDSHFTVILDVRSGNKRTLSDLYQRNILIIFMIWMARRPEKIICSSAPCVAKQLMKDALKCDGLNLVQNNGEVAGQTVNHFHLHLIPRYEGDGLNLNWPQQEISGEQLEEIRQSIKKSI
ncbi:MAG: HIT family protein [Anaerobutyricum soehngenii]